MRRLVVICILFGFLFVPSIASAEKSWCRGQFWMSWNRFGTEAQQANATLCLHSSGRGHELASLYTRPPHGGVHPGHYMVQLLDNGYVMANGPFMTNPWMPFDTYAGWIYHPYGGTYCAKSWGYDQYGWFENMPAVCVWTNGYQ